MTILLPEFEFLVIELGERIKELINFTGNIFLIFYTTNC